MFEEEDESWDDADRVRTETQGGDFVRLKDGDKVHLAFPRPPFAYRQVWNKRENRSEIYDPEVHDGVKPTGRFAFPVFEPVAGKAEYTPKIFDASGETYDAIKKARKKYGARYLYEVERTGSTMNDTKYTVMPERELKPKEIEYLRGLEPLDAEALTLHSGGGDDDDDPATAPAKSKKAAPEGGDPWGE